MGRDAQRPSPTKLRLHKGAQRRSRAGPDVRVVESLVLMRTTRCSRLGPAPKGGRCTGAFDYLAVAVEQPQVHRRPRGAMAGSRAGRPAFRYLARGAGRGQKPMLVCRNSPVRRAADRPSAELGWTPWTPTPFGRVCGSRAWSFGGQHYPPRLCGIRRAHDHLGVRTDRGAWFEYSPRSALGGPAAIEDE